MHVFRRALVALTVSGIATACAAQAQPSVVEHSPAGAKTILQCGPDEMPVLTEGPTYESDQGHRTRLDHGVAKCVAIKEALRDVDAGSFGSVTLADGRTIEVRDCAKGTVPFVLQAESITVTSDGAKHPDSGYFVMAPVVARCIETSFFKGKS